MKIPGMLLAVASAAWGQYVVGATAGTVQFTVGSVFADEQPIQATELHFPALKNGQVLRTNMGLVELLLSPAVFLRLSENSAIRMAGTELGNTRVEFLKGTALIEVVETNKADRIRIQFDDAITEFKGMGLYRFESTPAQLRVFGGEAEVVSAGRTIKAGRGTAVSLDGSLAKSKFNPNAHDDLHQWAAKRSFVLFSHNNQALERRTHWEATPSGWSWNRDFGMRLYSPEAAFTYRARQAREAADQREKQRVEDTLKLQDEQRLQQEQAAQALRQQQQQTQPPQSAQQPQQPQAPAPPQSGKK